MINMNKSKGQAFDTFKLMIAAVVAVAILGLLLSILSGISFGADPNTIMDDQVRKAYRSPPSIQPSTQEASFPAGAVYYGVSFKNTIGGGTVKFFCSEDLGTACDTTGETTLVINSGFSSKVEACCKADASPAQCFIGVGVGAIPEGTCTGA